MKKLAIFIIAASLILMYLLVLPSNTIPVGDSNSSIEQYSSIVPAKPPKVPGKDEK